MDARDLAGLREAARALWTHEQLLGWLSSSRDDVAAAAAQCIGVTGLQKDTPALAELLHHSSAEVVQAAESALWRLWMRGPDAAATRTLETAIAAIGAQAFSQAVEMLTPLVRRAPEFAEAHHQLGLALHSLDRLDDADAEYVSATALNAHHFAAFAGRGHLAVQRGSLEDALRCYERSVKIHPRQPELQRVIPEIKAALERRSVA
ncbi:MAG: hypothetical protein D6744_15175 [Planctomycetota bacterium]|nr:MAG: hypothetical protein D6744_15175 [Planctomycetota bacterium]